MIALQNKWNRIYQQNQSYPEASKVLKDNLCLLPIYGKALDLACGLGGNAIQLAEYGLDVDALDISEVALQRVQTYAQKKNVTITTQQGFISPASLRADYYDVIVISRFLDRALCNAIMAALKQDGLLFYQTFVRSKLAENGPSNPDFLLASNELLTLFSPLTLIFYQEYARVGQLQFGDRNEAYFIGQKPWRDSK